MKFNAVDLTRMTLNGLRFHPQPLSQWPVVEIDVDEVKEKTCIASWRWDVYSLNEISEGVSECAWDALHLGFSYLLVDIISLPQADLNIIQKVIEFSQLYESLHAVIAYKVDPQLKRAWLKNEAYKILNSPTQLWYLREKWKLRVPLKFSLQINQVCTARLGLHKINTEKLWVCDTDDVNTMNIGELGLLNTQDAQSSRILTISLDREHQTFASDVLLVYELSVKPQRTALIAKLRNLKSNSVVAPALLVIWAMIEGLSVSVKDCDRNIDVVMQWIQDMLREASSKIKDTIAIQRSGDGTTITLEGAIEGKIPFEINEPSQMIALGNVKHLLVRCREVPAEAKNASLVSNFLEECVDYAQLALDSAIATEPPERPEDDPCRNFEVLFDDTPRR